MWKLHWQITMWWLLCRWIYSEATEGQQDTFSLKNNSLHHLRLLATLQALQCLLARDVLSLVFEPKQRISIYIISLFVWVFYIIIIIILNQDLCYGMQKIFIPDLAKAFLQIIKGCCKKMTFKFSFLQYVTFLKKYPS